MNTSNTALFYCLKAKFLYAGIVLLIACQQRTDVAQHPAKDIGIAAKDTTRQIGISSRIGNKVVFDIPALLPQTIPQVKARLGKPVDELQADYMDAERGLIYRKNNFQLEVYYIVDTPDKIDVISLVNKHDTTNIEYLLLSGNIKMSDKAYQIDTLRGKQMGTYRGIAVRYISSEADSLVH